MLSAILLISASVVYLISDVFLFCLILSDVHLFCMWSLSLPFFLNYIYTSSLSFLLFAFVSIWDQEKIHS